MSLTTKDKSLLFLIQRSTPEADGWYRVSATIWPLFSELPDDLVEKRSEENAGSLRLTARGQAVLDYL